MHQSNVVTESAVISCNVSYNKEIDVETLVGILAGKVSSTGWLFHLDTFFNELPPEYIYGVLKENNLSMTQANKIFSELPQILQGKNFKKMLGHE